MPSEGTYEFKSQLKKLHVTYSGITEDTIELTLNYQSTVHPPHIHYVDMRLDPRLIEHIESVEGKSTQYLGFETTVNFEPMDTPTYQDVPYYQNVYRVRLGGANGIFTGIPWGAEVYEAKIILHLNKKTSELPQNLHYTVETRGVGTTDDKIGSPVKYFDTSTMNSTTFIKLADEIPAPDKTEWLKNNSTATVEYESGGTLTTESSVVKNREEVEFGQGVMRIKYYIYPKMLLHHSYNGLIDQYKHYSMAVDLEDKLLDLIPEDAKIRVNAVRRIGSAYNHLEVPAKDYIVKEPGKSGGELRISVYGPETRYNPDKTGPTDPLINNHNMYIPADADGAMPTYVQIEIPIDESKAAENFDYNQYNIQMFYYNKVGRLVTNSLVRAFTNGAKTSNPPSILNGKAQLFGTDLKGTGAQEGSTIYVVSATDDPDNFTDGGLLKTGKGRLISKGKITKEDLTFSIENPDGKMFSEIVNEATGEFYQEGEKVYVFQAIPGRMMSHGQPVVLEAAQTQTPYIDPVTGKLKIDAQYFNSITGNVPKNDPTSDLEVTMKVYRGGRVEGGEVQDHLIIGGELKDGVPLRYKTGSFSGFQDLVYGPVKAATFDEAIAQNGYVEQNGDKNLLVVYRDGSFSVYHKNSAGVQLKNNGNIQKGDIIEIVATEEHNKESVKVYHIVGEDAPDGSTTAVPPNVGSVHPTVAGDGKDGTPGNDKNEVYDNKPLEKIRVQTHGNNRTKYKIEIKREGQEELVWTSGESNQVGSGWHDVTLPASVQLLPGDKVYVYQQLGSGINGWTEWSKPKVVNVTPDPNEYYYYEFEIYLEGKGDEPVETIKVHRNKQAYPEGTVNYPLPAVKASDPQISTPQTLIDFLTTKGVAQTYLYNRDASTQFSVRPTKDFEAYWANIAQGKQNANIAAHANNKYKLVFGKDPRFWGELLFNAGAQGYYNPQDFANDNEELMVTDDSLKYTGIKFNETTWANVKESTGITNESIAPKANPGYKFDHFADEQGNFVDLTDSKVFKKSTELTAQFKIDENQFFGYEVQYVYNTGTEEEPIYEAVPGKEPVKGQAPLESVVTIDREPVDGFAVKADQPKKFKVEYLREEQNGEILDNQVLNGEEPAIRQIVKVVYEPSVSEKPVITTEPVMDTTEKVEGTAAPYAGIKLYYAKNTAAAGEPENWVADTDKPLLGETTTNKDGKWEVPVSGLTVGEKIIAVAKDPLKGEVNSDPKEVIEDPNKFNGSITIKENPAPKNDDQVVSGTIKITPKPGEESPSLDGVVVEVFAKDPDTGVETRIGKSIANAEGNFDVAVNPKLIAGHTIIAKAQPKKSNPMTGEAIVA
ncbi:MAG: hypothetical protein Q4P25_05795, partial [Tissierellia bacterium]|nr:hypothetical protein [Tissierellia bacterium]